MSGSGHTGLWTEPKYPGDAVRILMLIRGNEIGDVRIQHYGDGKYNVAAFLPGCGACNPGDTPKTEPDFYRWVKTTYAADDAFDAFVQKAYAGDWQNFNRETGKAV